MKPTEDEVTRFADMFERYRQRVGDSGLDTLASSRKTEKSD
jgi:hypothetical protein